MKIEQSFTRLIAVTLGVAAVVAVALSFAVAPDRLPANCWYEYTNSSTTPLITHCS